jgi:Txe/YoeB family toxin of Txe-Axe toxin-antitoxin module
LFELIYTDEAIAGIKKLENLGINDYMKELSLHLDRIKFHGVKAGLPLKNKYGQDLRGCYKIYFINSSWRIVFRVVDNKIDIIEIVAVDERDIVYKLADQLLNY